MDNLEKKKITAGELVLLMICGFLSVFLIYFAVISMISPGRKLAKIKADYGSKLVEKNSSDKRFNSDSSYINLLKEKAFFQSRIAMAESDSIYITLDLPDSTASLEISGVTVHSAKIKAIRVSKILRSGNRSDIYSMFSSPMNIVRDYATFKKEPVMIKMAPKDTSEYKPDIMPDTSDVEPVNYILEMNGGIRIFVYQSEDTISAGKSNHFFFDLNDRLKNTLASLKSAITLKVPEYHPFIKIILPKADAKILYRAVPRNGQIAVFL